MIRPAKVEEVLAGIDAAEEYQPDQRLKLAEPDTQPTGRQLLVRMGDEINDPGTRYLWKQRFPIGGISILFSRPGAGKSTIAADLTARITQGKPWPDGSPCERGKVLYVKGEGTDASIRDRMSNAGANGSKYGLIGRAKDEDNGSPMIDLANDTGLLGHQIQELGDVRLVIVDTLDSVYPSMRQIDNPGIRRCLYPLQEMAEQYDVAVIALAHTNKGGYADPLDRLAGGRAIGGAARAVWYLGQQDRESDTYWMARVKVNDFKPAPPIAYEIVGCGDDRPGMIRWGAVDDAVDAWDLDQPPKNDRPTKSEQCAEWLLEKLQGGPLLLQELDAAAYQAGFRKKAYPKGKQLAGVESKPAKGSVPPKYWACLPGQEPPTPI